MTTVTPPSPPPATPAPTPTPVPTPLLTASAPPEVLNRLVALQVLEARVVDTPTRNQIIVESAAGQVTLRTPQPLPVVSGAQLTLQLANTLNDQVQVRLTAIDGKATGQAALPLPQIQPQTAQPLAAGAAATVQWGAPQRPAGIPALVVQAPPVGTPLPAGAPSWPLGTALTVRLASVTSAPPTSPAQPPLGAAPPPTPLAPVAATPGTALPASAPAPVIGAQPATAPPVTAPTATIQAPTAQSPAAPTPPVSAPLTAGSPLAPTAAPTSAPAPAAPAPAPPPAAPTPTVLTGTVQPHATGGMPLVTTSAGTLALQAPVALPAGATVVLEVTAVQTPTPTTPQPLPLPLPGGPAGAAFTQAIAVLAATDPEAARRLAAALPGPDGRMLTNTVAFAQAAASANPKLWIGTDALRALDRAGPAGARALRGLSDGLRDATSTVRDSGGAEWRTLSMPFGIGGTVERIQIITRRHNDAEDGDGDTTSKGGGGQRFLIQLDLSRLGALQLDGLYKKRDRRLDIIVRTHTALPSLMRQEISGIFANSAMALALKGGVTFHVSDRFAGPAVAPDTVLSGLPTLSGMMV